MSKGERKGANPMKVSAAGKLSAHLTSRTGAAAGAARTAWHGWGLRTGTTTSSCLTQAAKATAVIKRAG